MKKLVSKFYEKAKMILPLQVRIWIGKFFFEYIDLIRFWVLKDKSEIKIQDICEGYVQFLQCMGIKGINFQRVNPMIRETILISLKPYVRKISTQQVFISDDMEEGALLTLTSRSWEISPHKARRTMDAKNFLLAADYFLRYSLEEMLQSAMEAVVLGYRSVIILDTNPLSLRLSQYCHKNFGTENFQIITEEEIKYQGFGKYVLHIEKKPDVIVTCDMALLGSSFITFEKESVFHLPFFCLLCGNDIRFLGYRFEQDVANNILPDLVKNDVQVMIFSNPSESFMRYLPYEHTEQAHIELKQRELNSADYLFFGKNVNIRNVISGRLILKNHCLVFDDREVQDVHWKEGERFTTGNTGKEKHDLYIFGPCFAWGNLVPDDKTIGSNLRLLMGEDSDYAIHNCGCTWEWMPWMMRNKDLKKGDMAIIFAFSSPLYKQSGWKVIDISAAYQSLGNDIVHNCWDEELHINYRISESIAKLVFQNIKIDMLENERREKNVS